MKFDMHCHTKEGSMDGKVMIEEYIRTLKRKGFGGMLVSDHDSYDGYREWKNAIKGSFQRIIALLDQIRADALLADMQNRLHIICHGAQSGALLAGKFHNLLLFSR